MITATHSPSHAAQDTTDRAIPVLLLLGLAAYCSSFAGAFLLDDNYWIVEGHVDRSLLPTWWNLSNRWVVNWTVALNYALDGENVRGYHLVNVAIHLAAALTLYGLVRRTLLLERVRFAPPESAGGVALAAALLWMLHPLVTQGVDYVIQRHESLMGFLYLLTLYGVLRGATAERRAWGWYAVAVAACTLGIGCKEVMVSAPLMALLYDWIFLADSWRQVFRRRWPLYAALTLSWVHVGFLWMIQWGPLSQGGAGFDLQDRSPYRYALSQTQVILHYLKLSFWPSPLCFDYQDWEPVSGIAACWPEALLLGALLVGTSIGVLRRSWLGFLGAWFFLTLAPSSSFMPLLDLAFEHRFYLPLAAVAILAVVGGHALLTRLALALEVPRLATWGGSLLVVGVATVFAVLTFQRHDDYRSALAMWSDVVAKRPNNTRARFSLASVLNKEGRGEEGVVHMKAGLERDPSDDAARYQLTEMLVEQGRLEEAEEVLRTAPVKDPPAELHLAARGLLDLEQGRITEAIRVMRQALQTRPQMTYVRANLATALFLQGQTAEAALDVRMVRSINPKWEADTIERARKLLLKDVPTPRDVRRATLMAELVCLDPRQQDATHRDTLAIAYALAGRFAEAATQASRAEEAAAATGQLDLADRIRARLRLYQHGRAYRYSNAPPDRSAGG